jgi:hypothetical protein
MRMPEPLPMKAAPTVQSPVEQQRNTNAKLIMDSLSADSRTTAEVLKELRRAFPDMPLTERVAALNALSRS